RGTAASPYVGQERQPHPPAKHSRGSANRRRRAPKRLPLQGVYSDYSSTYPHLFTIYKSRDSTDAFPPGQAKETHRKHLGPSLASNAPGRKWCQAQNSFFHWRKAANTLAGSLTRLPRYLFADATTAGRVTRTKGLVAFSRPMVEGRVGRLSRRSCASLASRSSSAALSGSTAFANPILASVYSWPQ